MKQLIMAIALALCLGLAGQAPAAQETAELKTGDTFSLKFDPPVNEVSVTVTRLGQEMAGGLLRFCPCEAPMMKKRIFIKDKPVTETRAMKRCAFEKVEFRLDKGRAKINVEY